MTLQAHAVEPPRALPSAPAAELAHFAAQVGRHLAGELDGESLRRLRLSFGVYGQRQPGVHMLRVKLPAGRLRADGLAALAGLAGEFGHGVLHLTTRQDVQLYHVPLARVPALLARLDALGFTTREACGNTVRNVTACPLAGAAAEEPFDVHPYALAIARYFLRDPFVQQLARKFKLALSGCPEDCVLTAIHDLGLRAAPDPLGLGRPGFTLLAGGGLGASPFVAGVLAPFVTGDDLLPALRAALKVYAEQGNRRQRTKARLKFVVARLGIDRFRAEFLAAHAALTAGERSGARLAEHWPDGFPPPGTIAAETPAGRPLPGAGEASAHGRWLARRVRPHRDPALALATVAVTLGDLPAAAARRLAALAGEYSGGELRLTVDQNVVLPAVSRARLRELHDALLAAGLAGIGREPALSLTACAGADTCAIGLTSSKGLSRALENALAPLLARPDGDAIRALTLKISGCPNACGQHHVADLGLHGVAGRFAGAPMPAYQLHLGGSGSAAAPAIGRTAARVPARRTPAAIADLAAWFLDARLADESFPAFLARRGEAAVDARLAPFADDPGAAPRHDWGGESPFALAPLPRPVAVAGEPLAEFDRELARAEALLEFGRAGDALALLERAHFLLATALLKPLGVAPDSDLEAAAELRARLIDRGRLDPRWETTRAAISDALRARAPGLREVAALRDAVRLGRFEAEALLPHLLPAHPEPLTA